MSKSYISSLPLRLHGGSGTVLLLLYLKVGQTRFCIILINH